MRNQLSFSGVVWQIPQHLSVLKVLIMSALSITWKAYKGLSVASNSLGFKRKSNFSYKCNMQRPGRITLRPSMLHETHFLLSFYPKLFSVALRIQDVSNSRDRTFQSDTKNLTTITYKFLHTSTLSLNHFGAMAIVVDRPNFIQVTQVRFHIPMCLHHKKENLYLCFCSSTSQTVHLLWCSPHRWRG